MRKNIHRQFLGFLCAVMCACSVAVPCFAADVAASDPEISFYMENINDAQCVLTVQNGKASASGYEIVHIRCCAQDRAGDSEKAGQPVDHR